MSELIIWTYDRVPEGPRGFVRDLRLRWACEEASLSYAVGAVPFDGHDTNHLARQPFGQVPFLSDGELEMFESGINKWGQTPFFIYFVTNGIRHDIEAN